MTVEVLGGRVLCASEIYHRSRARSQRGAQLPPRAPFEFQPSPCESGRLEVFVDELGHLEHRDFVLAAKDWSELVVGVDHPTLLLILAAIPLDVLPQLFRDFRARHRAVPDDGAERRIRLHRLHERRIRCALRTGAFPTCLARATACLLRTTLRTALGAAPLCFFRCHSLSR